VLPPAITAATFSVGLTLVVVLALHMMAAAELEPLSATDAAMLRYAETGHFPLQAAAEADGRRALATGAALQTFGALFIALMSGAYGARRGFSSARARGWSNAFWMASVTAICLSLSIFHGLTPQKLDYLIGSDGLSAHAAPVVILLKRGLFAAGLAAFCCVLAHDMGYRLREACVDFGLMAADEERGRREKLEPSESAGRSRRIAEDGERSQEEGGFGHRQAPPPRSAPTSEEAHARAVLGVGADATRREIERAYRAQMKRAHPDHGGSAAHAAALNAARDLLLGR
jgi:hypothetical protein